MTPGLKFSLAARAAATRQGKSSSPQRIRRKARSREMGVANRTSLNAVAHEERSRLTAVLMAVEVTFLGSVGLRMHRIIHEQPPRPASGGVREAIAPETAPKLWALLH